VFDEPWKHQFSAILRTAENNIFLAFVLDDSVYGKSKDSCYAVFQNNTRQMLWGSKRSKQIYGNQLRLEMGRGGE
jgi:hypothetical protein